MKITENRDYDVAVCGGGFGGIAAALSAARAGAHVVLFEKQLILCTTATLSAPRLRIKNKKRRGNRNEKNNTYRRLYQNGI